MVRLLRDESGLLRLTTQSSGMRKISSQIKLLLSSSVDNSEFVVTRTRQSALSLRRVPKRSSGVMASVGSTTGMVVIPRSWQWVKARDMRGKSRGLYRTPPIVSGFSLSKRFTILSCSASSSRACSRKTAPSAVKRTDALSRSRSCTLWCRSSSVTCLLKADCEICSRSAAAR